MDWLERWFGFAPDNGDGTAELALMLAAAIVVIGIAGWAYPPTRAALVRFIAQLTARAGVSRGP